VYDFKNDLTGATSARYAASAKCEHTNFTVCSYNSNTIQGSQNAESRSRELGHAHFLNFNGRSDAGGSMHHHQHAKCRRNWSSGCWDIVIFLFSRWRPWPSAILNLLCAYLDHPRRLLGDLYRCAKHGWNRLCSFEDMPYANFNFMHIMAGKCLGLFTPLFRVFFGA